MRKVSLRYLMKVRVILCIFLSRVFNLYEGFFNKTIPHTLFNIKLPCPPITPFNPYTVSKPKTLLCAMCDRSVAYTSGLLTSFWEMDMMITNNQKEYKRGGSTRRVVNCFEGDHGSLYWPIWWRHKYATDRNENGVGKFNQNEDELFLRRISVSFSFSFIYNFVLLLPP